MYRKRSKKAPVINKPVSPVVSKPVAAAVSKQSNSSTSLSSFSVSNINNSSRRSPSPEDMFDDNDSPDEIIDEDDNEPQTKKHRLSLSMIVPSQRSATQMTQSRNESMDISKNKSDLNESEKQIDANPEDSPTSNAKENRQSDANGIKNKKDKKLSMKNSSKKQSDDASDKIKTTQTKMNPPNSQFSSKPSQQGSQLGRNQSKFQEDAEEDVFEMLSPPPVKKPVHVKKNTQQKKASRILSYMEDVVCNAGMTLSDDVQQLNTLSKHQLLFIKDISKSLMHDKRRRDTKQCVDNFMEDLEKYCSDRKKFKIALLPTQSDSEWGAANVETQDSLIRLLLSVDLLQTRILEFLLDKLNQLTSSNGSWESDSESELTWTQLILNQLRYLNKVNNFDTTPAKLFRVIQSTSVTDVKHEIIKFLPDIIGDDQRKEVVDELISVMQSERNLSASVLMSLQNLCLNEDEHVRLRHGVIESLKKSSLEHIPAFVWFLLSTASPSTNDELINGLRSELSIFNRDCGSTQPTQQWKPSDLSCAQLLVFEKLRDSILMSRKLADSWLKNISKLNKPQQHKPLDVLMLILLHSISSDQLRKRAVESALKNKIKTGILRESLISETFNSLVELLKQLFNDVLKISGNLLMSADVTVSQFGAFMYTECFVRVEGSLRRTVITELLDLARVSKGSPALSLLHSLTTSHPDKVAPFITLIMLLTDSVAELSIAETRLLMSVLCLVAFGPDDSILDTSSLQDVIYMLVQKQLICPDINVFRSGVVCTLTAIKYMVGIPSGMSNLTPEVSDSTDEDDNIVLSPKAKKAFNLLEVALQCTRSNSDAQILALDQLSFIIMDSDNMDKCFIKKVSSVMQGNLQSRFIIASSDFKSKKDGLDASLQFFLDKDIEDPIAICMSEAVVMNSNETSNSFTCSSLGSLIRVVGALERADLTEIDALLGCSIALPDPEIFAKFSLVEPYIQRLAMDCLFHTTNWFREIINTFVCFVKDGKPEKVVKRLRLVIHIQSLIASCLPHAVAYHPPACYFTTSNTKSTIEKIKKIGGPSKKSKAKKAQDGDETVAVDDDANDSDSDDQVQEVAPASFTAIRPHFRELDFDTAVLFTLPFTVSPKPFKDGDCTDEFGPKELMFMLDDFVLKLRHVLSTKRPPQFGKSVDVGYDNLSTVPIDHIVKTVSKLSSHFARFLQAIVEYSHNLISVHDGIWDAPGMFAPGTAEMKQCLCLILSVFNIYFSWQSIRNEIYSKFLTNALMKLGSVSKENAKSLNAVLQYCVSYLKDISSCVMDLSSAVNLVSLSTTLLSYQEADDTPVELDIGAVCNSFLQRRWYDAKGAEVKGAEVSRQIASILDVYLSGPDALTKVSEIINWLTEETQNLDSEGSLKTFPHFNKTNLSVLISCLCRGLGTKRTLEGKEYTDQLTVWDVTMTCLQGLTLILKAQDTKVNLRQYLKGSLPVLKLFLTQGINVCSCMFKMESLLVSQILKKLQVVTRYIQTVCNYSKVSKDGTMIQQLPVMRGCLESIVLAVKNMILQNECTDAFSMGAMRNKGLKGEIIASEDEEEETVDANPEGETTTESRGAESQPAQDNPDANNSDSDNDDGNMSDAC